MCLNIYMCLNLYMYVSESMSDHMNVCTEEEVSLAGLSDG